MKTHPILLIPSTRCTPQSAAATASKYIGSCNMLTGPVIGYSDWGTLFITLF